MNERRPVRHTVPFTTSLHPAAAAALSALADREPDGHASGVISRLVRAELDRLAPGAWDLAMQEASIAHIDMSTPEGRDLAGSPAERAASAAKVIRDALGRARFG